MLKIYIATQSLYFATNIVVGKEDVRRIEFSGGIRQPKVINGTFATDDKDLQAAIESDKSFGIKFKLKETIGTDEQVTKEPEVKIFANVAEGKDWFNQEKGIPHSKINNRSKLEAEAAKLGYKLVFESDNLES